MNDRDIRLAVLEVMNAHRKKARHELEVRMHISQIERGLRKAGYKITDPQVMQAVDYLRETKMLGRTQETSTIKMPPTRGSSTRQASSSFKHTAYWYKLTAKAMDLLEGETEFSPKGFVPLQNIHINTVNAPVIIGSNNNVSNNITIFNQLDELAQLISEAEVLSVEERQDVASDIVSLKQQLAKPNPNGKVASILWTGISRVADLAGAGALAMQAAKGISAALGHPIS